jgi:type IX secretion system PorP/SprF family membrane protein
MLKKLGIILISILISVPVCFGQGIDAGPAYQMVLMNNPALSGSDGGGVLRLSYINFYPGNNYNFNSVYFSYDSYIPGLHGGAGFYLSEDYLGGIINELRGGLSYSYFLQAGENLFINAGLAASVFHRGFNFDKAVLPDQIDPLGGVSLPSSEILSNTGKTVFDLCTGFLFISGKVSGGFSINHLTEPELSSTTISKEVIKRKYFVHLTRDMNLNKSHNLKIEPLIFLGQQGGYFSGGAGTSVESKHLAINAVVLGDNQNSMNIQTGFSFNTSIVSVYYNYQFNVITGNNMLPLSLLHQVGLAFSLKNVEKRKLTKTINFPKL